ncbi:MAG: bifunctional riboflavin kinase/FAD synthetase [Fimbriimonadales bacterium]|nr:bifunctional riboflavin kinase/FAD synthetase [Fimbriimonadales bacterium]
MSWVVGVEGLRGAFPDGCAVTMGVFDGVHRGHSALIAATTRWARAHGVPAVALTFDPHPAAVLAPAHRPPMLCPLAHRVERLRQQGIDVVVVQPFTPAFAQLSPEAFIEQVLRRDLNACAVVVGDDFRFGRGRAGSVGTLRQAGVFEVITVDGVLDESGERVSSTRIRELIHAGRLAEANALLGEPLHWTGVATRGDGRGRGFGYPTANLTPIEPLITPREGVYACIANLTPLSPLSVNGEGGNTPSPFTERGQGSEVAFSEGGEGYPAAVSVGKPPMFENARGRVEAYLIDFPDRDLYGRVITLRFLRYLRPQQQFESIDALLGQMARDVEQTRQIAQEVQSGR